MISPSDMCTAVPPDSDGVQDWGDLTGPQGGYEILLREPQVAASVSESKALLQVEEPSFAVKLTSDPGCVSSILESPESKLVVVGISLPVSSSGRGPPISAS